MQSGKAKGDIQYFGAWDCGVKIWRGEGLRGLYKGNLANIVRGFGGAIVLVMYDELKRAVEVVK